MTISQIRYFTTVAQLENISRAADLLHLSQSSLSKCISKLEAELETPLFHRNGKKITLNESGARFLECSNLILRELKLAVEDIHMLSTGLDSKIKIGMAGSNGRLIDCIAAFNREHPGTEFDLNCGIESLEYLDINDFDALIYPAGIKYEKFTGYPLCEERYFLAVSTSHPLASHTSVSPKALDGLDFVFLRNGKASVEYPFRLCVALAVHFGSQCYVDAREAQLQMITAGIAVGFVPDGEAGFYQNDRNIRLIPILNRRFSRSIMICFRRDKHLSQLARTFRDFAMCYFHLDTAKRDAASSTPQLEGMTD